MQEYDSKEQGPVAPGAQEKRCSGPCGRLLPPEAFYPYRWRTAGVTARCKECIRQDCKERYARRRANDRQALRAEQHAAYLRHRAQRIADVAARYAVKREEIGRYNRAYRLKNAALLKDKWLKRYAERHDEMLERQRRQYRKHRPKRLVAVKDYARRNPHVRVVRAENRRARQLRAPGRFSAADIALIYEAQRGRCAYCLAPLAGRFDRDHMVPLGQDGTSNWPWNIALACRSCNNRKKDTCAGRFFARLIKERRALGRRVEE